MDAIRSTFRNITDSVMNVSNEERLVREATTMDKWGPTAQQMKAICDLTFQHASFLPVMKALMQRLSEPGKYWRHVYKALLVIDYALKNGSPEVADFCRQHIIEIQTLQRYQHIDENNRDQGLNVRERAKIVLELINDEKKLEEERKRAYACRDKYVGVSNDGSTGFRGSSSFSSRTGSSRYGSVSYEDSSVPSRTRDDADSRWGMSDSADDTALPEPEPLPEPVAQEPPKAQTNLFDTDFSAPASKPAPAQTGSLFDSLDMAPSQPAASTSSSSTSFFANPAPSQPSPAGTTSFFDSPAAAPAPAANTNTMSFFDMPASQPAAQPAPAPKADPMSFFDMPASQPMQPSRPAASSSSANTSFFGPSSSSSTSQSSSSFAFTSTSSSSAQPASPAKKDDMWGGLVNLDSLGSTPSSPSKASGPMAGSTQTGGAMSSRPMSSMSSTGPAMRPMGSTMSSSSTTMGFTSSSQPMQPTTGPNYDALRQPQYNPYAQQQQMYRMQQMQQMQMQQRYTGSGF